MNKRKIVEIFSGQYLVSKNQNLIISTLLGSCIAVCLYDKWAQVGGMNHFMLPSPNNSNRNNDSNGIYGLPSLELMITELLQSGAMKSRLEAKVFGGAKVVKELPGNIPQANIEFTLDYLAKENIKLISTDTGGEFGRKILFDLSDFSVYVKTMANGT